MLDIKFIRENKDEVAKNCVNRRVKVDIEKLLFFDDTRRQLLHKIEELRGEKKKNSQGKPKPEDMKKLKAVGQSIKKFEMELATVQESYLSLLYKVPNISLSDVPIGKDETENKIVRSWGEPTKFSFPVKDHVELGEALNLIDIKRASKISGSRFAYLKGDAVLLQFALVRFAFETLSNRHVLERIASKLKGLTIKISPFVPVVPPVMIRPEPFRRMARLSDEDKDERYYLPQDDVYLVGSAEHTLGSMYMDETLSIDEFPIRYVGYSTSFRREAGSYGKDTRGILRVHQFDKLEMESFTLAEDSTSEQDFIVAVQEYLLQQLNLPYRVVMVCTGDMGRPDARQIDLEIWVPSQNTYRETHTSDHMTDYQTRRLNMKVRLKDGTSDFVHSNDATVFAIGRMLIAILENGQQRDGSIKVPGVLQAYLGKQVLGSSRE